MNPLTNQHADGIATKVSLTIGLVLQVTAQYLDMDGNLEYYNKLAQLVVTCLSGVSFLIVIALNISKLIVKLRIWFKK